MRVVPVGSVVLQTLRLSAEQMKDLPFLKLSRIITRADWFEAIEKSSDTWKLPQ